MSFKYFKMRKVYFIWAVLVIFVIAAAISLNPYKSAIIQPVKRSVTSAIPLDVAAILRNSCAGCHGDGGGKLARSVWNFSSWYTYSPKKQSEKSTDICNAMTDGSMPPLDIRESYPDKVPTAKQVDLVCKWANSLMVEKDE